MGICINVPAPPWDICNILKKERQMPDKCPGGGGGGCAQLELTDP